MMKKKLFIIKVCENYGKKEDRGSVFDIFYSINTDEAR